MGHYDDYYVEDELRRKQAIESANKAASKLLLEAMAIAQPANKEQFRIKINEALYWLENK